MRMTNLSTTYLGLSLQNPLLASSSSLTDSVEKLARLEEAGIGAVVLKSLFEEQILLDSKHLDETLSAGAESFAETTQSYFAEIPLTVGSGEYLKLIENARRRIRIPVIASINCIRKGKWGAFAREMESAGAHALELNIYAVQTDPNRTGAEIERSYLDIVSEVRQQVKLPLAVKLSPFLTSIPNMVAEIARRGANAVVLFNRFYQPNLDLEELTLSTQLQLSRPEDALLPLRWIALLYARVPVELVASGGIHDGKTALKVIAAGAQVATLCSALFRHKEKHIAVMLKEMAAWLSEKEYASIDEVRGILSQKSCPDPQGFERAQYIRMLVGHD
jgi:dihydroorotate dehydrogenase (fumarate)